MGPRPAGLVVLAVWAALLGAAGCGTWGDGSDVVPRPDHPETWPPTNATECLRVRPPVGDPLRWSAAVAVRDWWQPVRDGHAEVVVCGQGSDDGSPEPLLLTVTTTGGVRATGDADLQWQRDRGDLVAPVDAEVTGPGTLTVTVADRSGARQRMTVWVLRTDDGLVLAECHDPDRCAWD